MSTGRRSNLVYTNIARDAMAYHHVDRLHVRKLAESVTELLLAHLLSGVRDTAGFLEGRPGTRQSQT